MSDRNRARSGLSTAGAVAILGVAALGAFVALALLTNIFERRQEGRQPFVHMRVAARSMCEPPDRFDQRRLRVPVGRHAVDHPGCDRHDRTPGQRGRRGQDGLGRADRSACTSAR